ncbi:MAG: baseplate J/gp47 family protein [Lachnospiraceae bacterium]|nr:baseplate J/gp47 family protein [Lachnospiraceae bacterium]MDE7202410.1 baseplate J/gp47 family protein [Lachnospiraceae bacterium]
MYENTTYEAILQRMLDRVPDKFDKREGSVIWDTHSPTAIELQILYLELDVILKEAYGDSASREFLILRCKERGIYPHEATKAVLKGVFVPSTIDVTGQRFNIGNVSYIVTGKIADGEYQVECETAGKIGNQFFGSMVPIEYITGLQTAELTEILIPGEDEEETENLRQRYFDSFNETAFGGNRADYLEKVNAIPGVGGVKVTRVWNHNLHPADMIPNESVDMWHSQIGVTLNSDVKSWLDTVYDAAKEKKLTTGGTVLLTIINSEFEAASEALVQTVQTVVDPEVNAGEGYGLAPIGHVVNVKSVEEREVTVRTTIIFEQGYGWGNLQNSLEDAVSDYLLKLRKEWASGSSIIIRLRQIENHILNLPGIVDMQDTLINDAAENLTLGEYEIPVFGGISHD